MTWVFTYDISDDTVRAAVAHLLEQYGERVQKSVFECRLDRDALDELTRRLGAVLPSSDYGSVRVYRACADCLSRSFGLGTVASTTSRPATII